MSAKGKEMELAIKIAGKVDPSLQKSINSATGQVSKGFNGLAIAAAAAAVATVAFGVKSVQAAAEYETQLANIKTLLNGTADEVAARTDEIGKGILKMSNNTGVATETLTDGMYQVVSAFGDSEDALDQLEIASKAAVAGNASTTDSVNLLAAVTKGYGDTSKEAMQKAADLAFQTVKLGQTSYPELASSMGKVIPLAATLGVEQEQLFGVMATLTGVTGSTSEVVTQLQGVMQGFLSPSKEMAKAIESLGYANGQAMLDAEGLQGSLELLKVAVNDDEIAFANMFSQVGAKTAVLALAGEQADNLTDKTKAMYDAAGIANSAFETQTDTLAYTIGEIKNLGKNFMTEVGQMILPMVKDIAEKVLPALQTALGWFFESAIPKIKDFGSWCSANGPLLITIISTIAAAFVAFNIVSWINKAKTAFIGLNVVMSANPIGIIIVAIGALVAAFLYLWNNCEGFRNFWIVLWDGIKNVFITVFNAISGFFKQWGMLILLFVAPFIAVPLLIVKHWDTIKAYMAGVWEGIKGVFSSAGAWFSGIFSGAWEGIKSAFSSVGAFFQGIWDTITDMFTSIGTTIGNAIGGAFAAVVNAIIGFAENMINGFINSINLAISLINAIPGVNISPLTPLAIPRLAEGGIATSATLAMIGEGNESEAVLPLSKLSAMLDTPAANNSTTDEDYTVVFAPVQNFYGSVSKADVEQANTASFEQFKRWYEKMEADKRRKCFAPG